MAQLPLVLDVAAPIPTLRRGRRSVPLRGKTLALVAVLAYARVMERRCERSGWVTAAQVSLLPEWASERSAASLRAQIRREIKALARRGFNVIETRPRALLKGPFRLASHPVLSAASVRGLEERFRQAAHQPQEPGELLDWLESAEPVWRSAFTFDKGSGIDIDQLAAAKARHWPPAVRAIASITRARWFRDRDQYDAAAAALVEPKRLLNRISNPAIRQTIEAQCWIQQGWIEYRRRDYKAATTSVQRASEALRGAAELKTLGQILSLRSLILRQQGLLDDALRDLWLACEYWLVSGDLYNLLSAYHNLSCVLMEAAEREPDPARAHRWLEQAVACCRRGELYCQRQDVAQNSVISKLLLAVLHARMGDWQAVKIQGDRACADAVRMENWAEAMAAHRHRIRGRLMEGAVEDARRVNSEFVLELPDAQLVKRVQREFHRLLSEGSGNVLRHRRQQRQ